MNRVVWDVNNTHKRIQTRSDVKTKLHAKELKTLNIVRVATRKTETCSPDSRNEASTTPCLLCQSAPEQDSKCRRGLEELLYIHMAVRDL